MYTIKGKEYSEFDINKRCAEILGSKSIEVHPNAKIIESVKYSVMTDFGKRDYCNDPSDAWPIIEKCWFGLFYPHKPELSLWQHIIKKHKCTKLVAACICFIELN